MTIFQRNASRDGNYITTLIGVSSLDGITPVEVAVDPDTGRILTDSAGGFGFLSATGTVNSSNTAFTFTTAPSVIIVDQGRSMQKTSSDGTVNWTGTTSVTLAIAPTFDIYGLG